MLRLLVVAAWSARPCTYMFFVMPAAAIPRSNTGCTLLCGACKRLRGGAVLLTITALVPKKLLCAISRQWRKVPRPGFLQNWLPRMVISSAPIGCVCVHLGPNAFHIASN